MMSEPHAVADVLLAPLHCTSAWPLIDSCYKLPQVSATAGEATDGPLVRV